VCVCIGVCAHGVCVRMVCMYTCVYGVYRSVKSTDLAVDVRVSY